MFEWVTSPYCAVGMLEPWDAPAGRFFTAYRARGGFRALAGHATIDEFATLSSPIFLCPQRLLGRIYNLGISLVHRRDHELGLDLGWPPLCIGLELTVPEPPASFEAELLGEIQRARVGGPDSGTATSALVPVTRQGRVGSWRLERAVLGAAVVLATDAPLLPLQLWRLCEVESAEITVAVATGNRLERPGRGTSMPVAVASERQLGELVKGLESLGS